MAPSDATRAAPASAGSGPLDDFGCGKAEIQSNIDTQETTQNQEKREGRDKALPLVDESTLTPMLPHDKGGAP
jgi:hypothetical protein